jgi:glycosyltransferase involved in cell wall biosynthesis
MPMKTQMRSRSVSRVDLVAVVNGFPRLSETFVLQELLELEGRGVELHVVALRHPEEAVEQEGVSQLRADVEYLPDLSESARRLALRAAHAALLLNSPTSYLHGIAAAIASPDFSRSRLERAVVLAHRIVRLGSPPLYVHFAHRPATIARFAARLAGVRYALSAHAKDIWLTPDRELAGKVRDAEIVLTCTQAGHDRLLRLAGGRTPVRLAYHGVDLSRPLRGHREHDVPVVLSVGRLVEKKGHATLLRAVALLRERGVGLRLRIVGDGPLWPVLQRLTHELALGDTVSFLGPLTAAEVRVEYDNADIFALACIELENGDRDGIPNVILEAMAHGLAVVSTTGSGVAEAVVDGRSGLLAAPGDPHAFAAALTRVLHHRTLREQLGRAARWRVESTFDSRANLPVVLDALADAGIVRRAAPAHARQAGERGLRAVG